MIPLILALTIAAPIPKDAKKETPTLVGAWAAETSSTNGMKVQVPPGAMVTFNADGTMAFSDRSKSETINYTHDPKKSPAEIDIEMKGKGLMLQGIYKIEGDTLTIAMAPERPKSFEEGADNMAKIIVCKRAKKE